MQVIPRRKARFIRSAAMYTARYWWMRSPNYWNANNTRIFNPSGALSNNNAYNTNGAAADCENSQFAVGFMNRTPCTHTRSS